MTDHILPSAYDNAAATPCLPNDILGDVIDILAEDEDFDTLKNTALLSSFCLHHSQQHIFRNIDVSTAGSASSPYRSLQNFVLFFSDHSALLPYVHHFTLHIIYPSEPDSRSQALQDSDRALCPTILLQACNLTTLSLEVDMGQTQAYLPSFSPSWTSNCFAPIRNLLERMLYSHQSLVSLSLTRISDFPITVLSSAPYLRNLSLDNAQLISPPEDIVSDSANEADSDELNGDPSFKPKSTDPRSYLESLRIDIMQPSHFQDTTRALLHRVSHPDGQFLLALSNLKKLHVGLEDSALCFTAVSDILQAHGVSAIEDLSIRVPCPMKGK